MKKFSIIEINKKNVKKMTADFWKNYFDMRIQQNESPGQKTPFVDADDLKNKLTSFFKEDKDLISTAIIKKNEEFYGYINLRKQDHPSRDKYLQAFYNSVFTDEVKEIVPLISKQIKKYYKKSYGKILFLTDNSTFAKIGEALKGRIGEHTIQMALTPKDVNKELIKKWMKETPDLNKDIRIEFYDKIPNDLIEGYTKLFDRLMKDMPKPHYYSCSITPDDLKKNQEASIKRNVVSYTYLAFNKENKIIGMTNIAVNKNDPRYPYQYMTGTYKEYRNRGISKWLKAANFYRITKDFKGKIREIITETSPDNYGSKRISKLMGYKYVGCRVYYELKLDNLPG